MLYLIGIGFQAKDISLRAIEAIRECEEIYLENYTNKLQYNLNELEDIIKKKVNLVGREFVESSGYLEKNAKSKNIALLVIGDPLSATTHSDIIMRARENKVGVEVIQNISIFNLIAQTGLQLYKFGKTTSITYPQHNFFPTAFYDVIKDNLSINAHTLILLDLRPSEKKFMSIKEAIEIILKAEEMKKYGIFSLETKCIACSKLGTKEQNICYAPAKELKKKDFLPPCCLIIPAKMHFMEEDYLKSVNNQ